ncbi:MAG: CBS domain-containing protein [Flavobacteriales bacterium]|nr:CBS domain-containing protein [Flavobacteriales bacterium]
MKISASIYSNSSTDIGATIRELEEHHIDMLHVDCIDDQNVFSDIKKIRDISEIPIDLHLITSDPIAFESQLKANPVNLLTVQWENLNGATELPKSGYEKLGLALTSNSSLEEFKHFEDDCDFVLLMATEPGKSGGSFNKENFKRIRAFKRMFPNKEVHVDGGVNAEVSFILRNLGVHCAVSGSYLFNQKSVGGAVLNLKNSESDSRYLVSDFMRGLDETPIVLRSELNLKNILQSIDDSKMAFTTITGENGELDGIVSNADVRKGLLKNIQDLSSLKAETLINETPIAVDENLTVTELLRFIRHQSIPINFLPVVNNNGLLRGSLKFNDLIKGEA